MKAVPVVDFVVSAVVSVAAERLQQSSFVALLPTHATRNSNREYIPSNKQTDTEIWIPHDIDEHRDIVGQIFPLHWRRRFHFDLH